MADDHDDDNENVHNPIVVKCQKIKYGRLLELDNISEEDALFIEAGLDMTEIELQRCIGNIKDLLSSPQFTQLSDDDKAKVLYVLSVLKGGGDTVISLTENKGDDGELVPILCISVFNIVWRRIGHLDNVVNATELKKMMLDKLAETAKIREINDNNIFIQIMADAMNVPKEYNPIKFELVCPYGIVSNIIDVLTLLDADPILAKPPMDMCELKNEAYLTAYRILNEALKSEDMEIIYNKEEEELTDAEIAKLKKFDTKVRLRIKKQLTSDYSGLVDSKKLKQIIRDANAGL
jgi:hypothetical protein